MLTWESKVSGKRSQQTFTLLLAAGTMSGIGGSYLATQHTKEQTARPRDARETRRLLVEAARQRFARDGYAATTVRQIADDVGVNVALINRYFESKEGLFEACLASAASALSESADHVAAVEQLAETISRYVIDTTDEAGVRAALLLLLRSSGDTRAEEMRVATLRGYGERLAALAGWEPGQQGAQDLLLRAQLVLATAIGIVVLRTSARIGPLASARVNELYRPLSDLIDTLLR